MSAQSSANGAEEVFPRPLGDRYVLHARLGVGGMGVVYEARGAEGGPSVAIKLLRPEYTAEALHAERFVREARAVARIDHPNVVRIVDLGQAPGGQLFYAMELLDGETLAEVLRREGRLPPRRAVSIAVQVCRGLAAAHACGIVHRDLKLGNVVLVTRDGDPEFVKVFDFGVAKLADDVDASLTKSGVLVGTPDCMSPEQITGAPVDARTDVYALGVMLFRLLSGTALFQASGIAAMVNCHLNVAPDSLLARAPDARITPSLDAVVQRCLAKRPEDRFASMQLVEEALLEALEGTATGLTPAFSPTATAGIELDTAARATRRTSSAAWERTETAGGPLPSRAAPTVPHLEAIAAPIVVSRPTAPTLPSAPQLLAPSRPTEPTMPSAPPMLVSRPTEPTQPAAGSPLAGRSPEPSAPRASAAPTLTMSPFELPPGFVPPPPPPKQGVQPAGGRPLPIAAIAIGGLALLAIAVAISYGVLRERSAAPAPAAELPSPRTAPAEGAAPAEPAPKAAAAKVAEPAPVVEKPTPEAATAKAEPAATKPAPDVEPARPVADPPAGEAKAPVVKGRPAAPQASPAPAAAAPKGAPSKPRPPKPKAKAPDADFVPLDF